jgi:hypothetical protein
MSKQRGKEAAAADAQAACTVEGAIMQPLIRQAPRL